MPKYTLTVNANEKVVEADAETPLLWVLRDHLNLTGTKYGCGIGVCGACTVHYQGKPVKSCNLMVSDALAGNITTIEGLSQGQLHPIQEAWKEVDVPQCGYCQAGQLMSAAFLVQQNPTPTDEEINAAMASNLCRCGTYGRIRKAIKRAATKMN